MTPRSNVPRLVGLVAVAAVLMGAAGVVAVVTGDDGSTNLETASSSSTSSTTIAAAQPSASLDPLFAPGSPSDDAAPGTTVAPPALPAASTGLDGGATPDADPASDDAESPAPDDESESTTTAAPAPSVDCADPWTDLEGCGWPGETNTGPRLANCPDGLTNRGDSTSGRVVIDDEGAVVRCQRISGTLVISARGVTVTDSIVTFDGGGRNGGGAIVVGDGATATIDHVAIDGLGRTHACVWYQGESVRVDAINCRGVVDGVFVWPRTGVSASSGNDFVVANSYFHQFSSGASNGHMDGFQTAGAVDGVISGNTYLMPLEANSAIAVWNEAKSSTRIAVTGNLIAGAQYAVYAHDYHPSGSSPEGGNTVTEITFTNNLFSTRSAACVGRWGVWYEDTSPYAGGPTDGWRRSGNRILETGQSVDDGNHDCR